MTTPAPDDLALLFADMPAVMTAKHVGFVLGINVKTVYAMKRDGRIPYLPVAGVRFLKSQVIEWLRAQNFRPRMPRNGGTHPER